MPLWVTQMLFWKFGPVPRQEGGKNAQEVTALPGRFEMLICVREGVLLEFDHLFKSPKLKLIVIEILTDLTTLQSNLEDKNVLLDFKRYSRRRAQSIY